MATSYSHKSWGHTVGYWWYEVSESNINTSNNTSVVTVNFYVKAAHGNQRSDTYNNYPAGYGSSTPYSRIYINGTLITTKTPACFDLRYNSSKKIANGTTYHLGSASATITHNSSGGGSVSVKCQHYTSVSPNWVTLESSHGLKTITQPAPPPPPPPPAPAPTPTNYLTFETLRAVGTLEVGGSLVFYWDALTSRGIRYLSYKVTGAFYMNGDASNNLGSGGNIPAGVIPNGGTVTLTVTLTDHGGQSVSKSITLTIAEKYQLYFNDLYIDANSTYIENGKYTAGKTAMYVKYSVTSTFDIKRVDFQMWGSNSNSGGWNWPGKSSTWNSGTLWGVGELGIKCTVTDTAGHTVSKDIYARVYEEEHRLNIATFEQQNGNIYIQKTHTIGSTKFKLYTAWDNTHTITSIKYEVTGANPMSYTKNNPGGKSFTWTTDSVTKVGDNTIKVTITDSKGSSKSSTIYVKTSEEPANIVVDDSKVDTSLCVDLVKGLAYKDYSRLGIKMNIVHSHRLQTIKVTINGREHSLKNFDANASVFTLIDDKKIEKSGYVTIKVYAKDVNGKSDDYSFTYMIYEIVKPPKKPTVKFEKQPNLYLSEGEKIVFYGESKDIKDYQIIYVLSACDVINAMKFCDTITNSYLGADNTTLTSNLNKNATGALRYHIFKDFGVSNSPIQYQNAEFHLHPTSPNHDDNFYALQFFEEALPGDLLYIYVRERKMGTFDEYLYSDNYEYNKIPKNNLFPMCVIPPAPCKLSIYKQEQTSDKMIIKYSNPLYNSSVQPFTNNLIDICLIAKNKEGKLLNKAGTVSKSETRKRDGLNGKTWIYYSDRQWHNIVPSNSPMTNNKKEFEMIFDISKYPKGTCFAIVAFYYTDYWNHPSIYSTSNIININKTNIQMSLKIQEPANGSTSPTANPTMKIRVSSNANGGAEYTSIYEDYNLATRWDENKWNKSPVWFRRPRTKDAQMPNFTWGAIYIDNQPAKQKLTEPDHYIECYHKNKDIYQSADKFRISGISINDEGSFKENALFLRANDNNQVYIGDIETSTLLDQGFIDFTWTQKTGRFLSIGENTIEAFTTPYLYDNELVDYTEHQSYWISDTTLYSMPIMPYNLFRNSMLKPAASTWDSVEGDILTIKIPYQVLKPNKEYSFTFSYFADSGFFYDEVGTITNSDLENLCQACLFIEADAKDIIALGYNKQNIIYSPSYCLITNTANAVQEVNNYNKWLKNKITFVTPGADKMIELDKENVNITIDFKVRGINILKMKDFTLVASDGSHTVDVDKKTLDVSNKENAKSIKLFYQGSIDMKFGYINPLSYKDQMDLRDYLKAICTIYGITPVTSLRTLVKEQSYIIADDYNNMKKYCIELFSSIEKKYPHTFNANLDEFNALPTITKGTCRGPSTFSNGGKHYFPEWDALIDAIGGVFFKPAYSVSSSECVTWSTHEDKWIRHNEPTLLKTSDEFTANENTPIQLTFNTVRQLNIEKRSNGSYFRDIAPTSNTLQLYYNLNKQQSIYFFFDQTYWTEFINQKNKTVQIIFTAHSDQDAFNINDFLLLGHNFKSVSNFESEGGYTKEIISTSPIVGQCTSYNINGNKQIVFICNTDNLKNIKGFRLALKKTSVYLNMACSCTIKYY